MFLFPKKGSPLRIGTVAAFAVICLWGLLFLWITNTPIGTPKRIKTQIFVRYLSQINGSILQEADSLGRYPVERFTDDLREWINPEVMKRFLGKTTGEDIPGDLAPGNVFAATTFVFYAIPAHDKKLLFKMTPEGVFLKDNEGRWMQERRARGRGMKNDERIENVPRTTEE